MPASQGLSSQGSIDCCLCMHTAHLVSQRLACFEAKCVFLTGVTCVTDHVKGYRSVLMRLPTLAEWLPPCMLALSGRRWQVYESGSIAAYPNLGTDLPDHFGAHVCRV